MMMQSIPTKASGLLFGASGSANLAMRTRENNFEMLLTTSIKRDTKITVRAKTINGNFDGIKDQKDNQYADEKEGIMDITRDNSVIASDNVSMNSQTADSMTKDEESPVDSADMDLIRQVLSMLGQIENAIMEELDLTPEELDSMMSHLGLEPPDLTDPQAIMQLLLTNYETTDPLAMLVNEELGDSFQGLLRIVNDIKKQADLKLTDDEISKLYEQKELVVEGQELFDADEGKTLQPQLSSQQAKDEDLEGKENIIKLKATSDDREAEAKVAVIGARDGGELEEKKDGKSASDRTDGFETFLDRLSANYDRPIAEDGIEAVRLYEIRDIAQQIIEQIRVIINPEQTTMELQLNPEHLGKVNLTISSKEGAMTAHFTVQNELAKEAVEGQLITLKETLAQQGIKVESIEVTVASYTFDQNSQSDDDEQRMKRKQGSRHKLTFDEAIAMSEDPLEEADNMDLAGVSGYTIDYTA